MQLKNATSSKSVKFQIPNCLASQDKGQGKTANCITFNNFKHLSNLTFALFIEKNFYQLPY